MRASALLRRLRPQLSKWSAAVAAPQVRHISGTPKYLEKFQELKSKVTPTRVFFGASFGMIGAGVGFHYYSFMQEEKERELQAQRDYQRYKDEQTIRRIGDLKSELANVDRKFKDELQVLEECASNTGSMEKLLEREMELVSQLDEAAERIQREFKRMQSLVDGKEQLMDEISKLKEQITSTDGSREQVHKKMAKITAISSFESRLNNGGSFEKELAVFEGVDPLIDAAIAKVPEEAMKNGVLTPSELQTKLSEIKVAPPSGEANAEVKEGEIDVLNQVDTLLKAAKLLEAADVLERGLQGTEAETVAQEWAKQARMRATIAGLHELLQASALTVNSA